MSLDTTDAKGDDLAIPGNVRIYHFASTQHGGFSPVAAIPTSTGICEYLPNVNPYEGGHFAAATFWNEGNMSAVAAWVKGGVLCQ